MKTHLLILFGRLSALSVRGQDLKRIITITIALVVGALFLSKSLEKPPVEKTPVTKTATLSPPTHAHVAPPTFADLPLEIREDLARENRTPSFAFEDSVAWNGSGGFSARYAANHGMRIQHPADGWDVRMKLTSTSENSAPVAEGDTLFLNHGKGLTERWANGPAGVEHAVLVDSPEALERAVFEVRTPLEAAVSPGGRGVEFRDIGGQVAFRYSGYRVIDSAGKTLTSELSLTKKTSHTWQLALLADDAGARYPLTLDPLMSTTDGRILVPFAERSEGDLAGFAVAISGDRMVVCAPRLLAGGTGGTARVYHFNQIWRREATLESESPMAGDSFGKAVDIWGTRIAISAADRVLVYELSEGDTSWELLTTLNPTPDGDEVTSLDDFGQSVALEGDLVFVGAPGATVQAQDNAGAVQVFRLPAEIGSTATVLGTISAPSPQAGGIFGTAVSASEGLLAVGAPLMSPSAGAPDGGTAFVYGFNPENLAAVSVQEVDPPNDESNARFGLSISIENDTLAVGSPTRSWPVFADADAGVVEIFKLDPATSNWPWKQTLAAPDGTTGDFFGASVALSGDTIIVGAPEGDFGGDDPGTAYIFERFQGETSPVVDTWGFAEKVRATGTNSGFSVAASGDHFVLGAPSTGMNTGQVNTYTRRSTRWREASLQGLAAGATTIALDRGFIAVGKPALGTDGGRVIIRQRNSSIVTSTESWGNSATINPPTPQVGQDFGAAVALHEPWLAVGAPGRNSIEATDGGACYLYLHVGSDWIHVATYTLPLPETGDRFGSAISMTDRWLAIGSEGADAVRIYDRLLPDGGLKWGFTQELDGDTSFGSAVALHPAGQLLAVGTPNSGGGSTRVLEFDSTRAVDPWVFQANIAYTLSADFPAPRTGTSLAFRGDLLAIGEPGWPGGGRVALREWNRLPTVPDFTNSWGIRYTLTVPDAPEDAELGTTVALSDRFVVAGAPGWSPPNSTTATGAAFVFDPRRGTDMIGTGDISPHHTLVPQGALLNSYIGGALAADGSEIAVGSNSSGTVSVYTRQWWAWTPASLGSFGDAGFQNGYAVDIEGDYLAFSIPFDDVDSKAGAGSVRLYKRNRSGFGGWGNVRTFFSPEPAVSGNFGLSLGFSGNALLIGAPGEQGGEGVAYLFERNEGGPDQWGMSRRLALAGIQPGDDFGAAVGIDADTIAIGAPGRAVNTGALFFYGQRIGDANPWVYHQETAPPLVATQTFFARSIAVQQHRVLVGATGTDLNVPGSGSAHLYGRTSEDNWGLVRTFLPDDQQTGSLFGFSVALDGPFAIVGAPRQSHPNGIESGAATLFFRDQGSPAAWGSARTFYPAAGESFPTAEDRFGWAVALRGQRASVSAPQTNVGSTSNAGAIHVFDRNATSSNGWDRTSFLTATTGAQFNDLLGRALAMGPDTIVAGVPLHDRDGIIFEADRGRVILFEETGSAFAIYLAAHGLPANEDPLADPDNDGLTTLEEAYLNSDPTTFSQGFHAVVFPRQGLPVVQWREGKETHGTTATVQVSQDLITWSNPRQSAHRTIAENATTLTREATLQNINPAPARLFFRLLIQRR